MVNKREEMENITISRYHVVQWPSSTDQGKSRLNAEQRVLGPVLCDDTDPELIIIIVQLNVRSALDHRRHIFLYDLQITLVTRKQDRNIANA